MGMDDVAERLKDTAVYEYSKRASDYSPWKWQHVRSPGGPTVIAVIRVPPGTL